MQTLEQLAPKWLANDFGRCAMWTLSGRHAADQFRDADLDGDLRRQSESLPGRCMLTIDVEVCRLLCVGLPAPPWQPLTESELRTWLDEEYGCDLEVIPYDPESTDPPWVMSAGGYALWVPASELWT